MEIRSISPAAALRVAVTVLGVVIALRFLWIAHAIFIVTFLGILLGLAVSSAAGKLERFGIRRPWGAPLVLLAVLGILVGLGALAAPSIRDQAREVSRTLPQALRAVEQRVMRSPARLLVPPGDAETSAGAQEGAAGKPAAPGEADTPPGDPAKPSKETRGGREEPSGLGSRLGREMSGLPKFLFPVVSSTLGAFGGIVMVLFIAMYVAAEPRLYREGALHLVPQRVRPRAAELFETLGETLRQWLIARLMAMVVVGVVTALALAALGVRGSIALGVLSGLLEFVPFFGPIASAVPAIGVAFIDSPQKAFYVVLLYIAVQQLEGSVLTPLLLKRRLDIPPVLTIVAVAALGVVFGVLGMLIAEPLLAAVLVATKMLYVEDVVGDELKQDG